MGTITETVNYDSSVYSIDTTDAVLGGAGGPANAGVQNLANRTAWLKQQIITLQGQLGTSTTQAAGDNTTDNATTAFVENAVRGLVSVNVAAGGTITLTPAQYGVGEIEFIGAPSGAVTVIFPALPGNWILSNQATGGQTLTVKTQAGTGPNLSQGTTNLVWSDGTNMALVGAAGGGLQAANNLSDVANPKQSLANLNGAARTGPALYFMGQL